MSSSGAERLPRWILVVVFISCFAPWLLSLGLSVERGTPSQLHTLLEWSAAWVAILTAALCFLYLRVRSDPLVTTVAVASVLCVVLDGLLAVASFGLIEIASRPQDFIPLTWALSRFVRALALGAGVLWLLHRNRRSAPTVLSSLVGGAALALIFLQLTRMESLPPASHPGAFVKHPWDLPALVVFVATASLLLPRLAHRRPGILPQALMLSMAPEILSQLHMVFGSAAIHDYHFASAHFLKLLAYLLPLTGMSLHFLGAYEREAKVAHELERTVSELDSKEVRLNQLAENIREVFWISDQHGAETCYVSPAYEDIFGLSCESLYRNPLSFLDVVHPDDRQEMIELVQRTIETEFVHEFRIIRGDEVRWLRIRGFPIKDTDGRAHRLAGLTEDITDQKTADQALRQSVARNRALLEAMPDLMFSLSRDGVFVDYHARKGMQLYRQPEELLSKHVSDVLPEHSERILEALARAIDTGAVQTIEYRITIGGYVFDFEARLVRSSEDEALAVVRDVTEQRRLERELLDVSHREQERIGSDLHDGLSQQLTGVALLANVLRQQLESRSPGDVARARKIQELVQDAIGQTRILAKGLAPVDLEEGGLSAALEELANGVEKLHSVKCRYRGDDPVHAGDHDRAVQLYRIAQEAVNNALKHAAPTAITIDLTRRNGRLRLSVQDDGKGFESTAPATGMGLRIMRYRARMIDADLHIGKRPPKGTIVRCEWPTGHD